MILFTRGILIDGKAGAAFAPWGLVSNVCVVPASATTKKEGEDIIAFCLKEPCKYGGKFISQILWSMAKGGKIYSVSHESKQLSGFESEVITSLTSRLWKKVPVISTIPF